MVFIKMEPPERCGDCDFLADFGDNIYGCTILPAHNSFGAKIIPPYHCEVERPEWCRLKDANRIVDEIERALIREK